MERGVQRQDGSDTPRHLLDVDSLSQLDILGLVDSATEHLARVRSGNSKSSVLYGKSVYTLFFEDSTRTRVSFEQAGKWLGADVINISTSTSSVNKGESLLNTTKTLCAVGADALVIRHPDSGAPHFVARYSNASVINAGDGMHGHPTQALLDVMTLRQQLGDLMQRRIAVIGDVAHSRVARSSIVAFGIMGARVTVAGPPTLMPAEWRTACGLGGDANGLPPPFDCVELCSTVEGAVAGADAVMTLRLQRERQTSGLLPDIEEYARVWGINAERMSLAKPDAPLMHPGPMNEGVEITSDIAHSERSVITDQVENGVAMRMAVLEKFCEASRML